ncbi:MAG: hypothetical protein RMJ55_01420 [Roseiflexaceae bacterium]|nr:hypothetical protein [Roseiflexus sp.]MDW8212191.1 hypothetical protein [Roseiflexaceae bacterium]
MPRTVEVIVHADGRIEPLEPIVVSGTQRGLLTILETPSDATEAPQNITVATLIAQLRAEGLLTSLESGAVEKQLSLAERIALAQRVSDGRPLSQVILEDREERF